MLTLIQNIFKKAFLEHQQIQVIWCSCTFFTGDPLAPLAVSFTMLTCSRFSAAQSRPRCIINREALLPLLLGRRLKHSLQTLWDLDCFMPVRSVHTDCFKRQRASCRPDHRGPWAAMKRACATACYPVPRWHNSLLCIHNRLINDPPSICSCEEHQNIKTALIWKEPVLLPGSPRAQNTQIKPCSLSGRQDSQ